MITAIPVNDDRVANHFTKASHLVFVDERGTELSRTENPALGADCSGKRELVNLLVQQRVSRVVVRNIGERMLGKLLGHQIAVYQTDCGRRLFTEICDPDTRVLTELNKPDQGLQSFNHEAKGKKCCHSDRNSAENACLGGTAESGTSHGEIYCSVAGYFSGT